MLQEEIDKSKIRQGRRVVYCRLVGALAYAARRSRWAENTDIPLVVTEGRMVRDVSHAAAFDGVEVGQSVRQAQRFCPMVVVVPLAEVEFRPVLRPLWEILADVSPVVEPLEPDAAYADLSACGGTTRVEDLRHRIISAIPFATVMLGEGQSRLTARACAECGLPPEQWKKASVQWLWPEDPALVERLLHLGLTTFQEVAAVPEASLVYQFGKVGRLLHQRANGYDQMPVQALYPLLRVDIRRDFPLEAIEDQVLFQAALLGLVEAASAELKALGRYGRRIRLVVQTEQGECTQEAIVAAPVQGPEEVVSVVRRLAETLQIFAAVIGLRLLIEDLDVPTAITNSLFTARTPQRQMPLESVRRRLVARFGAHSLMSLKDIPVSIRDQRRILAQELRGGV